MQSLSFDLRGIAVDGAVVDVETVSLRPRPDGMFAFGYMAGGGIRVLAAEDAADCQNLVAEARRLWRTLPRPIYAYNKAFVADWLADAFGHGVEIDCDAMEAWKNAADRQGLKWPRLRELMRPPLYYYRWGVADYTREREPRRLRRAIRTATSVNEVISRETVGASPHRWWQTHLELIAAPHIRHELERLNAPRPDGDAQQPEPPRVPNLARLPNGHWTTNRLAAIMCHNMMDLQSQASLLLWQWDAASQWLP